MPLFLLLKWRKRKSFSFREEHSEIEPQHLPIEPLCKRKKTPFRQAWIWQEFSVGLTLFNPGGSFLFLLWFTIKEWEACPLFPCNKMFTPAQLMRFRLLAPRLSCCAQMIPIAAKTLLRPLSLPLFHCSILENSLPLAIKRSVSTHPTNKWEQGKLGKNENAHAEFHGCMLHVPSHQLLENQAKAVVQFWQER